MGLVRDGGASLVAGDASDGDAVRCSGAYSGTYAGDDEGDAAAVVSSSGTIDITFLSAGAGFELEGRGLITRGTVEVSLSSGASASGDFDDAKCTMTGSWTNSDLGLLGTWMMQRQAPASTAAGCAGEGDDFRGVTLFRPDFRLRNLSCADFALAELAQPDFTDADLDNSSFRGADLEEPIFIGTSLRNADFRGALLTRAQFVEVDLTGADLQFTVGDAVVFVSTICPDGSDSNEQNNSCL